MKTESNSNDLPKAVAVDFDGTYVLGTPLGFIYQQNKEQALESEGKNREAGPEDWSKAVKFWESHNKKIIDEYIPETLEVNTALIEELKSLKHQGTKVYLVSYSPKKLIEAYLNKTKDPKVDFDGIYGSVQRKFALIKKLGCTRYYTDWTPEERELEEILGIDIITYTEAQKPILDYADTNNVLVVTLLENKPLLEEALEYYNQMLKELESEEKEETLKKQEKIKALLHMLKGEK